MMVSFSAMLRGLRAHAAVLIIAGLALVLGGCASRATDSNIRAVQIAPELMLALPRPGDLGQSFEIVQRVTARYGKERYVFEGHLQATPHRFLMVCLDPTGRRAMTINWTDATITYDAAPWIPGAIRPENILADMILLYWPADVLRRSLAASGATVSENASRRAILLDGKELIVADYRPSSSSDRWSGTQYFRNLGWGYELEIKTAEPIP